MHIATTLFFLLLISGSLRSGSPQSSGPPRPTEVSQHLVGPAQHYSVSFRFTVWCCWQILTSTAAFSLPARRQLEKKAAASPPQRNRQKTFNIQCKVEVQDSVTIWSNRQASQWVVIMKVCVHPSWRAFFGSESVAASVLWLMFAVWTRAASPQPEQMSKWLLEEIHSRSRWCWSLQNSWF